MKINVDILYENLEGILEMDVRGAKSVTPTLKRIEFFDPSEKLREDSIYLANCDMLDENTQDFKGISFICLGGTPVWSHTLGSSTLLLIKNSTDIVGVFRAVQKIFLRYEAWEDELKEILRTTASLLDMVRASVSILGNPIQISDHHFNLLAYTNVQQHKSGNIESYTIERMKAPNTPEFLSIMKTDHPKDIKKKQPYFYDYGDLKHYCINLFVHNRFVGNMQLIQFVRQFLPGDLLLFEFLSGLIVEALHKYTKVLYNQVHTRKSILKNLLEQKPIDQNWLHLIDKCNQADPKPCVCFKMQLYGDSYALPSDVVCQTLEQILPGCVAFEHQSVIVAFLDMADCPYSYEDSLKIFEKFLMDMDFQAGISDRFEDIQNARQYYLQAGCAIDTGGDIHPGKRYYFFEDYAVSYMLKHCVGEMESEFICPRGLVKLRERDESTSGDYWNTLRVYLENEMNATQTARQLFLHRSTLVQKLNRIYSILGVDIQNPMKRMYIQLCMNLLDMPKQSKFKGEK